MGGVEGVKGESPLAKKGKKLPERQKILICYLPVNHTSAKEKSYESQWAKSFQSCFTKEICLTKLMKDQVDISFIVRGETFCSAAY